MQHKALKVVEQKHNNVSVGNEKTLMELEGDIYSWALLKD